jgi:tetratricopeptide (TPR) repeat protein
MNRKPGIILAAACAASLILAPALGAAESKVWVEFENGKRLFREKEFGQALNAFRNAAVERRRMFETASRALTAALDSPQARRAEGSILALVDEYAKEIFLASELDQIEAQAGSSLRKKIDLLRQRRLTDRFRGFLDALYLTLDYRTFDDLGDSLDALQKAAAALAMYPEAEFWMGRVFQAEGELKLAEIQYARAWDMREAYEVSDDRFTPLYALADLYRTRGDFPRMEEQYLQIVRLDSTASDPRNEYLRNAMLNTLTRDGLDKFMSLYRTEGDFAVRAFDALGSFWYESGRQGKAVLYLGLAVNRILTKAIDAVRSEEPSYAYTTLPELLGRVSARRDLEEFARSAELHRLLFTLADALYANGARAPARDLWRVLAAAPGSGTWGARSAAQLRSPIVKVPVLP